MFLGHKMRLVPNCINRKTKQIHVPGRLFYDNNFVNWWSRDVCLNTAWSPSNITWSSVRGAPPQQSLGPVSLKFSASWSKLPVNLCMLSWHCLMSDEPKVLHKIYGEMTVHICRTFVCSILKLIWKVFVKQDPWLLSTLVTPEHSYNFLDECV